MIASHEMYTVEYILDFLISFLSFLKLESKGNKWYTQCSHWTIIYLQCFPFP